MPQPGLALVATLCSVALYDEGTIDVTLLVTRELRGAHMPVNRFSGQCDDAEDCSCTGGAHRRRAVIGRGTSTDASDVVALDTGAYHYGSGTFYSTFKGNASAEFFADAEYDAFGLTFRDFVGDGAEGLASYLRHARGLRPGLPLATVTNYNLDGDEVLGSLLAPYTLVALPGNETLAVLSLTDPTHMGAQPGVTARLRPFRESLLGTLALLRRLLPPPRVVVCMVTHAPTPEADLAAAARDEVAVRDQVVNELVREGIGVDVFILGGFYTRDAAGTPYVMQNWAGDDVLVAPAAGSGSYGRSIDNITISFRRADGLLIGSSARVATIPMACGAAVHNATLARLREWHATNTRLLGDSVGTLLTALDAPEQVAPVASNASCTVLNGVDVCGCRAASCEQGAFVADALAFVAPSADAAVFNAGSLRGRLSAGSVTRSALIEMLPFNNQVVVLELSGATLRLVLTNAISQLALQDAETGAGDGRFLQVSSSLP